MPPASAMRIDEAQWPRDHDLVAGLLREYVDSLGVDIGFQDVEGEFAELPGRYARPGGVMLIARAGAEAAGMVAYRPSAPGVVEMKRLYVRPAFRGGGLGRALAQALIAEARAQGFRSMRLDTLAGMTEARALYRALCFVHVPAYYDNPLPGAIYMALAL